MSLIAVAFLTGALYIGPLCLPEWFVWEKSLASAILPFTYVYAKGLFSIACLFGASIYHHKKQIQKRRIFKVPQVGEKGRLRLPNQRETSDRFGMSVLLCVLVLVFIVAGYSRAFGGVKMVAIDRDIVNVRSGPAISYKTLWQFGKGYPLKVVGSRKEWYKVQDFEGDSGWVYKPLVSRTPHVVVKNKLVNIRSRPGTRHAVIARAQRGVVFQTIASVKGWVKVRHAGGLVGWVARRLVWGW